MLLEAEWSKCKILSLQIGQISRIWNSGCPSVVREKEDEIADAPILVALCVYKCI